MVHGLPKTKEEALAVGAVAYFTGDPCGQGHIDKRYTKTSRCYQCNRDSKQLDRKQHPQRVAESFERTYKKHKDAILAKNKMYRVSNKEKLKAASLVWAQQNKDKIRAYKSKHQKKKRATNPLWRLSRNTCKSIWGSLRSIKGGRHWETLVGFTLEELAQRLESRFRDGMSWSNYGKYWELDHIKPISLCESFEEVWALDNLQPLTKVENCSKGNRYIG